MVMIPGILFGRPSPLEYADKVLKNETLKQIRSTKKLKRYGMKLLDTLAESRPDVLLGLENQGGCDTIIAKVMEFQLKGLKVLLRNESELADGQIPWEIDGMGWAGEYEFTDVDEDDWKPRTVLLRLRKDYQEVVAFLRAWRSRSS